MAMINQTRFGILYCTLSLLGDKDPNLQPHLRRGWLHVIAARLQAEHALCLVEENKKSKIPSGYLSDRINTHIHAGAYPHGRDVPVQSGSAELEFSDRLPANRRNLSQTPRRLAMSQMHSLTHSQYYVRAIHDSMFHIASALTATSLTHLDRDETCIR